MGRLSSRTRTSRGNLQRRGAGGAAWSIAHRAAGSTGGPASESAEPPPCQPVSASASAAKRQWPAATVDCPPEADATVLLHQACGRGVLGAEGEVSRPHLPHRHRAEPDIGRLPILVGGQGLSNGGLPQQLRLLLQLRIAAGRQRVGGGAAGSAGSAQRLALMAAHANPGATLYGVSPGLLFKQAGGIAGLHCGLLPRSTQGKYAGPAVPTGLKPVPQRQKVW